MFSSRTMNSAARTSVYGTLAAIFSINDPHTLQVIDAAVIGGVFADYSTWLFQSVIRLPNELWHGMYDGVINVIFGLFMFRHFKEHSAFQGDDMLIGFGAFAVVMVAKILCYIGTFVREENEDEV